MENKKPITENQREIGNKIYRFLYANERYVTKEELFGLIGWDTTKDRQLRDVLSLLAKVVPIIATSNGKGYKLAKTKKDLEEVEHQWKELDSRIEELELRKKPLIKFRDEFGGVANEK